MSKVKASYGDNTYNGFTEVEGYFKNGRGIELSGWKCPRCGIIKVACDFKRKVRDVDVDGTKVKMHSPKCCKCKYVDYRKYVVNSDKVVSEEVNRIVGNGVYSLTLKS